VIKKQTTPPVWQLHHKGYLMERRFDDGIKDKMLFSNRGHKEKEQQPFIGAALLCWSVV
jgi:hypothetical protein